MRIIAFDIGSTMAWAHNMGTVPDTASHPFKGEREARGGATLLWLHVQFRELKKCYGQEPGDVVIFERPFARGMAATRALWGLAGILEAVATNAGYACLDIDPATIKTFACGKGNATKEEMIAAAQIMGYEGENEHEADAWCLLHYAAANVEVTK